MRRAALLDDARSVDWGAVAIWFLCSGLIVYLGLKGGGYDPLVHDQVGIAIWWFVLAVVLVGALPGRRLGPLAWTALALLAAFTLWTGLSLSWTESVERTAADLARVAGYLGVFAFAVFAAGRSGSRQLVGAVAAGIVVVSLVALLSRFHPAWFSGAGETANFLSNNRERLSYPLHYWNGLAALIAIGLPLVLQVATGARSVALRVLAAAALPALVLTIFFTLSRSGIAAAFIALAIFFAFSPDRLVKLPTLAVGGLGGAILILAADSRDTLQHGLFNSTAESQGDAMLAITLVVCLLAGLIQAGLLMTRRRIGRPSWTAVPRRQAVAAVCAAVLVVLSAAAVLDAPGRASDGWDEFKQSGGPGKGADRLGSTAGQNRYQLWSAAVKENATRPLSGTGSGTFEYWWARTGDVSEIVRDTHSLYLQTLGELGIIGLLLLVAFMLAVLAGGGYAALLVSPRLRPPLAAALAGCTAFFVTAAFDWMWQLPVLPVAMLILAAALVTAMRSAEPAPDALGLWQRLGVALIALVAIVAIAIPLASTALLRQSEEDFREGNLAAALNAARSAENAEPAAASPRLQQALVLEAGEEFAAAAEAAREAAERESTNWRTWLVLSRIEAERGDAEASVRAYVKARSLNPAPRSSIADRDPWDTCEWILRKE